jgi:Uma2 family endonuclease
MATHPIAPPITADEFLRLYGEDDENRYELIESEVCERTLNGCAHETVKNNLKELFDQGGVASHGFRCWIGHSFRIATLSVMTSDVAILRTERLAGAFEIAIEVAINDKPAALQRKVSAYLANGAHAVCGAFPDLKNIVVYTLREWRELTAEDQLSFPALIPGLSIPVSAIFEGI